MSQFGSNPEWFLRGSARATTPKMPCTWRIHYENQASDRRFCARRADCSGAGCRSYGNVLGWCLHQVQVEAITSRSRRRLGSRSIPLSDNPATIKAQVEAGNVTIDVADVEFSDAVRLCDEGLLEAIDASMLPPAPDGTPASEDFIEGGIQDYAMPTSSGQRFPITKTPTPRHRRPLPISSTPRISPASVASARAPSYLEMALMAMVFLLVALQHSRHRCRC